MHKIKNDRFEEVTVVVFFDVYKWHKQAAWGQNIRVLHTDYLTFNLENAVYMHWQCILTHILVLPERDLKKSHYVTFVLCFISGRTSEGL